jgi:hypothetical protein
VYIRADLAVDQLIAAVDSVSVEDPSGTVPAEALAAGAGVLDGKVPGEHLGEVAEAVYSYINGYDISAFVAKLPLGADGLVRFKVVPKVMPIFIRDPKPVTPTPVTPVTPGGTTGGGTTGSGGSWGIGVSSDKGSKTTTPPVQKQKPPVKSVYATSQMTASALHYELAVDMNRDGVITLSTEDASDATTSDKPYRFWSNDDDDDVDTDDQSATERYPVSSANWTDDKINGVRDLEDFARLNIYMGGLQDAVLNGTLKIGLKWKNVTSGAPAIKVWRNLSPNGGTEYLTDLDTAKLHIALTQPGYVHGTDTYIIPTQFWTANGLSATQPLGYMLFEGCAEGKGQLVITIHKADGTEIGEGPGVWMDLKNIKAFYQRVKVTPRDPSPIPSPFMQSSMAFPERSTFDASTAGTEPSDDGVPFVAPAGETKSALVFVHGSNIPYEEARWNAETMFKRLYWQGYKGRFGLFYWDTLVGPWDGSLPAHYNLNEYRAWKYGPALSKYVANGLPSGYAKNVIGHSLGNGVILSALKGYTSPTGTTVAPMSARNVMLLQAAMPASCLDANAPTIAELTNLENPQSTPDLAAQKGYRGVIGSGVGATIFNIYNDGDYALGYWTLNQRLNKPESLSSYDRMYTWSTSAGGALWLQSQKNIDPSATPLRPVSDNHESMSFVARSRTIAAGRLIMGGSVGQNFDVGELSPLAFGRERPDHSGQFTRSIQKLWPLYEYINEQAR